jgi:hypothetical protein
MRVRSILAWCEFRADFGYFQFFKYDLTMIAG